MITKTPEREMSPHSDLVHFLIELYASQGVASAKPLSECGQGILMMTSDWGNKVFIEAAKGVSPGIFANCADSESDKGDRIESLFKIRFGQRKERSIGTGLA